MRNNKLNIRVFTRNTCPGCVQTKTFLDEKGIEYEEINIDTDTEARQWVIDEGFREVPVVIVDKGLEGRKSWTGFKRGELLELVDEVVSRLEEELIDLEI